MRIIQFLYNKLRNNSLARRCLTAVRQKAVIEDFSEDLVGHSGRALVSYFSLPLIPPPAMRDRTQFSNLGIAQAIPRALNRLGYTVDIISYDNAQWRPLKRYDLFLGHTAVSFMRLADALHPECLKIYFSTGIDSVEANRRAHARAAFLLERQSFHMMPERLIFSDETAAIKRAHGLIYLGNRAADDTYRWVENRIGINNACFSLPYKHIPELGFSLRRRSFLYFSGRGNLHKGLDLLIEAFASTNLRLIVCQDIQPDFIACYEKLLRSSPNIEVHGFVEMRSKTFRELAASCAWTISTSCAEGQPGAVLECMQHGLIPVLTPENNIDLNAFGCLLANPRPQAIREVCVGLSDMSLDEYQRRQAEMLDTLERSYSPDNFVTSVERAVCQLREKCVAAREEA